MSKLRENMRLLFQLKKELRVIRKQRIAAEIEDGFYWKEYADEVETLKGELAVITDQAKKYRAIELV